MILKTKQEKLYQIRKIQDETINKIIDMTCIYDNNLIHRQLFIFFGMFNYDFPDFID